MLYRRLCDILKPLPIDLVVTPGGVKQMPRIVFKCMVNYGGDFSKVSGAAAWHAQRGHMMCSISPPATKRQLLLTCAASSICTRLH